MKVEGEGHGPGRKGGVGDRIKRWAREVDLGFRNVSKHRPSPAMVVALIALGVSMTTGAYAAINIPKNSVGTAQLKKNAVTAAKIKGGSVVSSKIAKGAVKAPAISAGSVSYGALRDGSVKGDKIEKGAVGGDQIADNAVNAAKILADSISAAKLKQGAVIGDKLADDAVGPDKIQDQAIDEDKLADNSVGRPNLKDGAVEKENMAAGSVDSAQIVADAITAAKLAQGSVGPAALGTLPAARILMTPATKSVADNDIEGLGYDTLMFDTASLFNPSEPGYLKAPVSGIYEYDVSATFASNGVGMRYLRVWHSYSSGARVVGGQEVAANSSGPTPLRATGTLKMAAGDEIQPYVIQTSGGALDLVSNTNNVAGISLSYVAPAS